MSREYHLNRIDSGSHRFQNGGEKKEIDVKITKEDLEHYCVEVR